MRIAPAVLVALVSCAPLAGAAADPTAWLASYVRIDTSNPPGNERPAALWLADRLREVGVEPRLLEGPGGRPSVYARLSCGAPSPETVLLLHHIDVVAPGPGWTVPPFSGEMRDGQLWGRGAIDDKSLGIAHLAALADLARCDRPLGRDVALLAVADEEAGGAAGMAWLVEAHPELFAGVVGVLTEGGANKAVSGRVVAWGIEVAQKRALWLRATARGRGGHASKLLPESAAHRLVSGLARLLERQPVWKVNQAARTYFAALAPHQANLKEVLLDLDRFIAPDGPRRTLLPGMGVYFLDTLQVTRLEASPQVNVVAAEASGWLDLRLLPETDADAELAWVRETLGPEIEVEVLLAPPPAASSPVDHPIYRTLAALLRTEAPVLPALIPGITDARYLRARGIAAYGLSPFALEAAESLTIHGADERISIAGFRAGVERMRRWVGALARRDASSP